MNQSVPMEPYDQGESALEDFARQSREFLDKGREYLSAGDLHQASEKGWGAAAWMAKAVAEAQGWQYNRHDEFFTVIYEAQNLSGDARVRTLGNTANTLHGFYYTRKRFLCPEIIGASLDDMGMLLDILQPLTEPNGAGANAKY